MTLYCDGIESWSRQSTTAHTRDAANLDDPELGNRLPSLSLRWPGAIRAGDTRARGALYNLGHEVGRNTIKRVLLDHGLEPAPERGRRTSWRTFLESHLGAIAGADFFTVEVLTPRGLIRFFVFFVIDLGTRRVRIARFTYQPFEAWMKQSARNLTDAFDASCAAPGT